jgi:hypothetical protein
MKISDLQDFAELPTSVRSVVGQLRREKNIDEAQLRALSNDADYLVRTVSRLALVDRQASDFQDLLLLNLSEFDYSMIPGPMFLFFQEYRRPAVRY